MKKIDQADTNFSRMIWIGVGLALSTAVVYTLIAQRVLAVGNPQVADDGGAIVYVAAASYFIGGLLILARNRWLWAVGIVMNGLVMLFYFQLYAARPEVLLSPGGLISKTAQVLLEIVLLYLILTGWQRIPGRGFKQTSGSSRA